MCDIKCCDKFTYLQNIHSFSRPFFLVRVAEATALRKLEKPHGYRQTVTVLLAPHQDGTKQHTPRRDQTTHTKTGPNNTHQDGTKQGRRCSHAQDL